MNSFWKLTQSNTIPKKKLKKHSGDIQQLMNELTHFFSRNPFSLEKCNISAKNPLDHTVD